ncbi:uroporphyrinogen-III synthase [Lutimaribacter sp. EGI FJ00015]|uniref:Uroporphyrinogen-III synthase n=2 Tax=Lutimaribacter degradans TaxID=2945989 RepID=A0ACC5ZUI9_9RHOB|nr:uroporphyrinogen-III synthase [Lutimaribacter sp. EGI FJ00013]MCO0612959.1 uroporphyrinogen-III synthase [Lutimaribacter sp. EGI FJ00015]MCO0635841.1 uroporphyrinogen-III synthase [Lutimaribacter sp. EGI FJ00014]
MPTILLTRPAEGSARFAEELRARLGEVPIVQSPVLRIIGTGAQPDLSDDPVVLFTSRNGVTHCGVTPKRGQRALCVGDATAQMARAAGFDAVSASGDVEDLLRLVTHEAPKRPLLHLRGEHSAGDLAARLRKAGLRVRETVVYDQVPVALTDAARATLNDDAPVVVPLFSPRSAQAFANQGPWHAPLFIAAISAAAAQAAPRPSFRLDVAAEPTLPAMLAATCGLFNAAQLLERESPAQ